MFQLVKKYIKPFLIPVIAIIALLFGQAQCELALPDYMSNIVDTGIQNGGIEDGVPLAIRESEFQHLTLFMSDADKAFFEDSYRLIKTGDAAKDQLQDYPVLKKENVYELKDISSKNRDKLNDLLVKPEMMVTAIAKSAADKDGDLYKMMNQYHITDPFQMISMMPADQLKAQEKMIDKQIKKIGASVTRASGAAFVKNELKAIRYDTDAMKDNYIMIAGAKMLLIALGSALCAILVGLLASRVSAGFSRDLRGDVFKKVENFSSEEFNRFSTSSLITRTTNDVQQVQMVMVMFLRIVVYAPIIGFGAVLHVISSGASMTWIIAMCVIILLGIIGILMMLAMPKFKISQKLIDKINGVTREFLDGMPVVRAFNNQKNEEEKFDDVNQRILKNQLFINRTMSCMMPAMTLVMNGASLLIIWVGGHQIESGSIQVGDMMAFMQYSMQIIMAFLMIAMVAVMLPRASVSGKRVLEVLSTDFCIHDPQEPKHFNDEQKGYIDFQHVSFRYPGAEEDVLHDINFTAKPGETTAFIGSTGSGKSTVINLVPRFFDVTEGAILVDGVDIRDVTQHELREKIGYVPQKGVLFTGDIASNLRYAKADATDEELRIASDIAQATEFIDSKPEGYATLIAQGGTNVSGGQKQRLSIARALVKKPEIFIFDDSFSALDFKTDAKLRGELNKLTKQTKATVLLVAQRISSIMHAERIVVLDKGMIAGIGTHEELMKSCEVYQEIAYSQLSKEELGNE